MAGDRLTSASIRILHVMSREGAWLDQRGRRYYSMPAGSLVRAQVVRYCMDLGFFTPYHLGERGWNLSETGWEALRTHRKPKR